MTKRSGFWIPITLAGIVVFGFWLLHTPRETRSERSSSGRERTLEPGKLAPSKAGSTDKLSTGPARSDLRGVIVSKRGGTPIAGASVQTVTYAGEGLRMPTLGSSPDQLGRATTSNDDGEFQVAVALGSVMNLRVDAAGYAPIELVSLQAGESIRVELEPGVALRVRVVTASGNPEPDIGVHVFQRVTRRLELQARTDESGYVEFVDLPPSLQVLVRAGPGLDIQPVFLPATGAREMTIKLAPHRTLVGNVIDRQSRRPVAGARVGMGWGLFGAVETDVNGQYELRGWSGRGVQDVHVLADGYGRSQRTVGSATKLDFRLELGDKLVGRLLGPDGVPVSGAEVAAVGRARKSIEGSRRRRNVHEVLSIQQATSAEDGTFMLTSLRHDMPHTLIATASGYGRHLLDFDPHPGEPGTIDLGEIRLDESHAIGGVVVEGDCDVSPRVPVLVRGWNKDRGRLRGDAPLLDLSHGIGAERTTDDQGKFFFPDLSPGDYEISASAPTGATAREPAEIVSGKHLVEVTLVLGESDASTGEAFLVVVIDSGGAPVAGVPVVVETNRGASYGTTGENGQASVRLRGRAVRVIAGPLLSRGFARTEQAANEGDNAHRFVLKKAATIQGSVIDEADRPVVGALVELRSRNRRIQRVSTDSSGFFAFNVAEGQQYQLVLARGAGNTPVREASTDVLAGDTEVVLRAIPDSHSRQIQVRVRFADGAPAEGAKVSVFPGGPGVLTNAKGHAMLLVRGSGRVTLIATPPKAREGTLASSPKVIAAGTGVIEFQLRESRTISGIVLRLDGAPEANAVVYILERGRLRHQAEADREGRFTVRGVPADGGPWDLRATSKDGKVSGTVERVKPGEHDIVVRTR